MRGDFGEASVFEVVQKLTLAMTWSASKEAWSTLTPSSSSTSWNTSLPNSGNTCTFPWERLVGCWGGASTVKVLGWRCLGGGAKVEVPSWRCR